MKSGKFPQLRLIATVLFITAVILAVAGAYYFIFVQAERQYHTRRNFQLVAEMSQNLNEKVQSYITAISNGVKKAQDDAVEKNSHELNAESPGSTPKPGVAERKPSTARDPQSAGADLNQPVLRNQQRSAGEKSEAEKTVKTAPEKQSIDEKKALNSFISSIRLVPELELISPNEKSDKFPVTSLKDAMVTPHYKSDDKGSWLYLSCRPNGDADGMKIQVRTSLTNLIQPEISREAFNDVLVADQSGVVVFQRDDSAPRLLDLHALQDRSGRELDLKLTSALHSEKEDSQSSETPKPYLSASLLEIKLADDNYLMFVQPVAISFKWGDRDRETGAQCERYFVCGLVRSREFVFNSLGFSRSIPVIVFFLVGIGLAIMPIVRVASIGPEDRLSSTDVHVLLGSILVGSALLTFFTLDFASYADSNLATNQQLEELAAQIKENWKEELSAVHTQLSGLNEKLERYSTSSPGAASNSGHAGGIEQLINTLKDRDWKFSLTQILDPKPIGNLHLWSPDESYIYPYFENAVWIDSQGQQRFKWSTRSAATSLIKVSDRSYFQNIVNDRMWVLTPSDKDSPSRRFALEPLVSKNTAERITVLSIPAVSKGGGQCSTTADPNQVVATISFKPISLVGTVLPSGFGYFVIDDKGQFKYRSDESLNTKKNLIEECDNDNRIRLAASGRIQRSLDGRYLGRQHRFFFKPLDSPPWTLVVFHDQEGFGAFNLEVLSLATLLSLFDSALVLSIFLLTYSEEWLWPNEEKASSYSLLFVINALMGFGFCIALTFFTSSLALLFLSALVPITAMVVLFAELKHGYVSRRFDPVIRAATGLMRRYRWRPLDQNLNPSPGQATNKGFRNYRSGYVYCTVSMLTLVGVMPAIAVFKTAHRYESILFLKRTQVELARALGDRDVAIRERYGDIKAKDQEQFLRDRLAFVKSDHKVTGAFGVYLDFCRTTAFEQPMNGSDQSNADSSHLVSDLSDLPFSWFKVALSWIPVYSPAIARLREFADLNDAGNLSWNRGATETLQLFRKSSSESAEGKTEGIAITSAIQPFSMPYSLLWWIVPPAIFVLLVGVVRLLARKLFFLDFERGRKIELAEVLDRRLDGNVLVLKTRYSVDCGCLERAGFYHIDLRKVARAQSWAETFDFGDVPAGKRAIVIDRFDYDWPNPAATKQKLRFIERTLSDDRRIIVISEVDPTHFALPDATTESEDSKEDKEEGKSKSNADDQTRRRWESCLNPFYRLHLSDPAEDNVLTEAPEAIKAECGPRKYLQEIGMKLLQLEDAPKLSHKQVIERVLHEARPYYHALWSICSTSEKLLLHNLAKDRLVCSRNAELESLLSRGILVSSPHLKLMNESFQRFVIAESTPEEVLLWSHGKQTGAFSRWRMPAFALLFALALFLFVSQRDVYERAFAIVSAVAVGIPTVLKLLGMITGRPMGTLK